MAQRVPKPVFLCENSPSRKVSESREKGPSKDFCPKRTFTRPKLVGSKRLNWKRMCPGSSNKWRNPYGRDSSGFKRLNWRVSRDIYCEECHSRNFDVYNNKQIVVRESDLREGLHPSQTKTSDTWRAWTVPRSGPGGIPIIPDSDTQKLTHLFVFGLC